MYKIYGNFGSWEKLNQNIKIDTEEEVIQFLIYYVNKYHKYDFLIIERDLEIRTDYIRKRIRSEEDFLEYLQEYKETHECLNFGKIKKRKRTK